MDRIDKNSIEAVNNRDEIDESSSDYALSVIVDKINEIVDWINTQ